MFAHIYAAFMTSRDRPRLCVAPTRHTISDRIPPKLRVQAAIYYNLRSLPIREKQLAPSN